MILNLNTNHDSPESIARQVSRHPKSVSLKITNIMTPTDKIGETEVLYFRSVLEAARVISIKNKLTINLQDIN